MSLMKGTGVPAGLIRAPKQLLLLTALFLAASPSWGIQGPASDADALEGQVQG